MATNTQTEYTHATVMIHDEEAIFVSPWHEDWDSEILSSCDMEFRGFLHGYVRAKWGRTAKILREMNAYPIEVDGSVVAIVRKTICDLTNADQAAFCGYRVFNDPRRPPRDPHWKPR
jgi:hypothetical protein